VAWEAVYRSRQVFYYSHFLLSSVLEFGFGKIGCGEEGRVVFSIFSMWRLRISNPVCYRIL
jgi:hypothetical protein